MEILIIVLVLGVAPVVAAICLAAVRMALVRRGSVHKLSRIDLRGMFLITAALGAMLSLTRYLLSSDDGLNCVYVFVGLPFLLPLLWLARYAAQDLWEVSANRSKLELAEPDWKFLDEER